VPHCGQNSALGVVGPKRISVLDKDERSTLRSNLDWLNFAVKNTQVHRYENRTETVTQAKAFSRDG